MTFSIIPNQFSAGYSTIPIGASGSVTDSYEYLIDLLFNKREILDISPTTFQGQNCANVVLATPTPYNVKERIIILDGGNNDGVYTILTQFGSTLTIDMALPAPLGTNPTTASFVNYKVPPSPTTAHGNVDLSGVISAKLTENIEDTNDVYSGLNTRLRYDVMVSERLDYTYEFEDNVFQTGNVGFLNTTLSPSETPLFQIGDFVVIQQEQSVQEYNYFLGLPELRLQTVGAVPPIFTNVGQQLLIQDPTFTAYQGYTTLTNVLSVSIDVDIPNPTISQPPGQVCNVWGYVRPQYNTVARITNIFYEPLVNGWIITTDIPWGGSTSAIGGIMRLASGDRITNFNLNRVENLEAYNARLDRCEYTDLGNYEDWVISGECFEQSGWILENGFWNDNGEWIDTETWNDNTSGGGTASLITLDKISTIYYSSPFSNTYRNKKFFAPIQTDAFCHLLTHNEGNNTTVGLIIDAYDESDNLLATSMMVNNSQNGRDYYTPIGLDSIINSNDRFDLFDNIETQLPNIAWYEVYAGLDCEECNVNFEYFVEVDTQSPPVIITANDAMNYNPTTGNWEGNVTFSSNDFTYEVEMFIVIIGVSGGFEFYFTLEDGTTLLGGTLTTTEDCPVGSGWVLEARFSNAVVGTSTLDDTVTTTARPCCNQTSERVPFRVDECSQYERINLIFKDKRGSWAQYPFILKNRKVLETDRSNFYQQEGKYTIDNYGYDTFDRGEKSFITRTTEKVTLNSNWVTDQNNYIIEDLFKSAMVFIQNPDNEECTLQPVVIINDSVEIEKDSQDQLHRYQFQVKISNENFRL